MDTTREIPDHLQKEVLDMPEYSQGVTRIQVELEDGNFHSDVFVAWGTEIIKVGTSEEIPFDVSKIVRVKKQ